MRREASLADVVAEDAGDAEVVPAALHAARLLRCAESTITTVRETPPRRRRLAAMAARRRRTATDAPSCPPRAGPRPRFGRIDARHSRISRPPRGAHAVVVTSRAPRASSPPPPRTNQTGVRFWAPTAMSTGRAAAAVDAAASSGAAAFAAAPRASSARAPPPPPPPPSRRRAAVVPSSLSRRRARGVPCHLQSPARSTSACGLRRLSAMATTTRSTLRRAPWSEVGAGTLRAGRLRTVWRRSREKFAVKIISMPAGSEPSA